MNVARPIFNEGLPDELDSGLVHKLPSESNKNSKKTTKALRGGKERTLSSFIGQQQVSKTTDKHIRLELEDNTETTACETEFSDLSTLASHAGTATTPLRGLQPQQPSLRVLPHAVHETNDHDISIPSLTRHRILGEGFFGQVWLASSPEDDRVYALKRLSKFDILCEDQVESVINEKLIMLHLHHPFIVQLRASFQDESYLYLLQDFCQGGELFSLLHKETPICLPEESCRFYVACIADALWYMHCQDIVYRDLKPENVMLNHKGYPILIDLGYAKLLPPDQKSYTLCGTPKYLSPEMVEGVGHSHAVDYWALGIVLYELASGEHPFEFWADMDELTLYGSIAEAEYMELPEESKLSVEGRQVLDRLLIKTPTARLGALNESPTHNGVLAHPWMSGVNLTSLRRQTVVAPWVPALNGSLDDSHFGAVSEQQDKIDGGDEDDDDFLHMADFSPCLSAREQARFADFDG